MEIPFTIWSLCVSSHYNYWLSRRSEKLFTSENIYHLYFALSSLFSINVRLPFMSWDFLFHLFVLTRWHMAVWQRAWAAGIGGKRRDGWCKQWSLRWRCIPDVDRDDPPGVGGWLPVVRPKSTNDSSAFWNVGCVSGALGLCWLSSVCLEWQSVNQLMGSSLSVRGIYNKNINIYYIYTSVTS